MSGGGDDEVTVGYKYYLGLHMVLCHGPIDKLVKITVDGRTAWSGSSTGGTIAVNAENLFGGEEREGGVSGSIDLAMGESTQTKNAYLQSKLGSQIPAFRGVVSAILKQVYVGLNPYLKPWAFKAQRIHMTTYGATQWYDSKSQIGDDMNPAHIIRECLTDPLWGLGYSAADVDSDSFVAAADRLYSEGMGISLLWDKSKEISEFIGVILSHIQGSLYISRISGKFVLKLSRADYVESSLIELNESSVSKIVNFKRASVGDLINSVTVIYWDSVADKENSITVQDIALVAQQGCVISTTKQYPGFTTGVNATRAAATELQALSTPLASATIYTNRKASSLNVGDVFKLSWPKYGVSKIVMRVTSIELGALDSNSIKIEAVEDVFSVATATYASPPATNWVDPISAPAPCPYQFIYEAPYWDLAQMLGDSNAQALVSTATFAQAIGVRPSSDATSMRLYTKSSGSYVESYRAPFCPTAKLNVAVNQVNTTFSVESLIDLDLVKVGTYAIINSEIVAVDTINATSIVVRRGCLDTVPVTHAINSRIYFADDFGGTDRFEYALNDTARFKLLPITGKGTLSIDAAAELSTNMVARQFKPYAPGNLRLNGSAYPASISGELTVSWSHRDRTLQTVKPIIDTTSGNIGPESGVTYTLQLYGNGTLRKTVTGLTGASYTWSTEAADSGLSGIINVGNSTVTYAVATSQNATIPSGTAANDLLLAWVMHRDTLTPPAGWTLEKSQVCNNSTLTQYLSLYKRTAIAGDASAVTTWSQATSQRIAVQIQAYRHANAMSILAAATTSSFSNGSGSPETVDYSPVTPTIIGQMTVHGATNIMANTSSTTTVSASYGTLSTPSNVTENRLFVAYGTAFNTSQKTGSFTTNLSSTDNGEAAISVVLTASGVIIPLNTSVRAVLKAVRNGVDSYQSHDFTVSRI
jgi:hypothetical protein